MNRTWCFLFVVPLVASAETVLPLRVALQNESVSLPSLTRLFTNLNPGLEVGTELRYRNTDRLTLYQAFTVGLFHHDGLSTCPYATTAFGVRPTLVAQLFIEASIAVGYLANVSRLALFVRDGEGFRAASPVLHRFIGGLNVGVGYRFGRVSPFVSYGLMVEAPFLAKFSPVLPHQFLQVGVRFELPLPGGPS